MIHVLIFIEPVTTAFQPVVLIFVNSISKKPESNFSFGAQILALHLHLLTPLTATVYFSFVNDGH